MKYYDSMEFVSEEEAEEYYDKESYGYYNDSSFVQLNKRDNYSDMDYDVYDIYNSIKNFVVMAYVNGGRLYVAKRGYTYHLSDAKVMTEEEAIKKSKAMTKNGAYKWEVVII